MAPLRMEKARILRYIARALGEDGVLDVRLPLSYPALQREIPQYFGIIESVELHLGVPCDRSKVKKVKPQAVDLHLPQRDLYVELDREGHDFTAARGITLLYYPPGLPRGFRVEEHKRRIAAQGQGASAGMDAGRGLVDFVKDLYVEGVLGKVLVRLPKQELAWLLDRSSDESKLERLRGYLAAKAEELDLPTLRP